MNASKHHQSLAHNIINCPCRVAMSGLFCQRLVYLTFMCSGISCAGGVLCYSHRFQQFALISVFVYCWLLSMRQFDRYLKNTARPANSHKNSHQFSSVFSSPNELFVQQRKTELQLLSLIKLSLNHKSSFPTSSGQDYKLVLKIQSRAKQGT